ncbi:MAG: hypothetical protein US15_C0012G0007 [Candidatus Moranbacteria bacterium GW2011_GWF1_36_4]|nr:MAG: hypothetical protein US15_C0012G0007 [Candidatus Moranbacteria bacterium GW2011_GWF1_36_4]
MSTGTVVNSTSNQLHVDYDVSKVFVFGNRYNKGLYDEPSSGAEYTLLQGTILGRIAATGKLKICSVASTDGSQFPIGVVKESVTMASGATSVSVSYCIKGDVVEEKLLFAGSETLNSIVTVEDGSTPAGDTTYTKRLRDLIQSIGIVLVASTEMTLFDNQ